MDNITISVVLPTRNGEWCLPYVLESLKMQTEQPEEILICIGKSQDKTEEIVLGFQKDSKIPVRIFYDREGIGTGYAMNLLVKNAKSDILMWASSDVVEPYNWIETIHKYYMDDPNLVYLTSKEPEINSNDISSYPFVRKENITRSVKYNKQNKITSVAGLSSFKRKNILTIGNFDPFFTRGQDLDMVIRLVLSDEKGGEETPMGIHFGVFGDKNISKALKHGTYFKVLYKYGIKYVGVIPHHTIAVLLRTIFLLSILSLFVSYMLSIQISIYASTLILITTLFLIALGSFITYGKINTNLLLLQIFGCFGEYYQLYKLLIKKNKPPIRYGIGEYSC